MVASSLPSTPPARPEWQCAPVLGLAALAFVMAMMTSWLLIGHWRADTGRESQIARLRSGGALPILHAVLETRSTENELANAGSEAWNSQARQNAESRQQVAALTTQQQTLETEVRELQRLIDAAKEDSTKGVQAQLIKFEAETAGLTKLNTAIGELKTAIQEQSDALNPAKAISDKPFDPGIVLRWQNSWAQTPEMEKALQQIQSAAELRKQLAILQAEGEKADRSLLAATKKTYDETVVSASQSAVLATQKLDSLKAAAEAELKALTPPSNP